jgi:hypothetical protein
MGAKVHVKLEYTNETNAGFDLDCAPAEADLAANTITIQPPQAIDRVRGTCMAPALQ